MTEEHETRFELAGVLIPVAVAAIVFAVCAGLFIGFWAAIIVTVGFGLIGDRGRLRVGRLAGHIRLSPMLPT